MKIKLFSTEKSIEKTKLALIVLLFVSMLSLFVYYTGIKLGSANIIAISAREEFPSEKMWIFSGSAGRTFIDQPSSPYVFPSSVTFRASGTTYSVSKQKAVILNVYNDLLQYVSEVLGPQYTAQKASYNDYTEFLKSSDYTILSYDSELSAYILRLCCDKDAVGFYNGVPCKIKKLVLTENENERLIAYALNSAGEVIRFLPLSDANATAYPINSAVISAYNNNRVLVQSYLSFESDFFSQPQARIAPDIVFHPDMQFYEAGISNPMSFINSEVYSDTPIKNDVILSLLKNFKINTGLVRHYTDSNIIYFVESNAVLKISGDGYITYNSENGGLPLSKILGKEQLSFSIADKLAAAAVFIGNFGNDIIGGNGEIIMTSINYDSQNDILKFEFSYCFDSVVFYGLDKIELEIGKNSLLKAHIPTYSIYRNSVRKSTLIPPEVAYNATDISDESTVTDYKPVYILDKNGITANVGWIAAV